MIASLVWTLVAAVGLVVQIGYLNDTLSDWTFWHTSGRNGSLRAVAKQHALTAVIRTGVVASNAVLGCLSFTIHPTPPRSTWETVYGGLAILVLVGGEVALITLTWLDRRLRQRLAEDEGTTLPSKHKRAAGPL